MKTYYLFTEISGHNYSFQFQSKMYISYGIAPNTCISLQLLVIRTDLYNSQQDLLVHHYQSHEYRFLLQ